jgi:hypothetical protein
MRAYWVAVPMVMRARRVNRCYEIAHAFRAVGLSRCATVVSQRKLSGIDAVRLDEASWIKMFRASASPFLDAFDRWHVGTAAQHCPSSSARPMMVATTTS